MRDPELWNRLKEVYQRASALPAAFRETYLQESCGENEELIARARALLASDPREEERLETPAVAALADTLDIPAGSLVGRRIGPYRIVREIGEGGMGTAYLALRDDDQYRQEVAIKLVRRGAGSASIHRRFRQERQILASLEHPNIARLLDGGVTCEGWPYYVMEYVKGLPIDSYCNRKGLVIEQRVRLFEIVCSAVHYAHRNLIVHCDLKPSNILVTVEGSPKLLDFGIAKLLEADPLEPRALPTAGPRMMTPEYASPEQVRGGVITTASDIYSLGVVLYELLTGRQPYRFESRLRPEIEKVVCTARPARPSAAIGPHEEGVGSGSEFDCGADWAPDRLRRRLAGDLDNIALMALRKEPERRYGSVEQLSEDLERHRLCCPVLAAPDSFSYRAGKFIHRYPMAMVASAVSLISIFVIVWQAQRVESERGSAARTLAFLSELLALTDPFGVQADEVSSEGILDTAAARISEYDFPPDLRAKFLDFMGVAYGNRSLGERAIPMLEEALRIRREIHGSSHPAVAESLNHLGMVWWAEGDYGRAETLVSEALELRRSWSREDPAGLAESANDLGLVLLEKKEIREAEALFRQALEIQRAIPSGELSDLATYCNNLGLALHLAGELEEAKTYYRKALEIRRRIWPEGHNDTGISLNNLATLLRQESRHEEAEAYHREALALWTRMLGERHPHVAISHYNLALLLLSRGRQYYPEAAASFERAIEIQEATLSPEHPDIAKVKSGFAILRFYQEELDLALELAWEALEGNRAALSPGHPEVAENLEIIETICESLAPPQRQEACLEELHHARPAP